MEKKIKMKENKKKQSPLSVILTVMKRKVDEKWRDVVEYKRTYIWLSMNLN